MDAAGDAERGWGIARYKADGSLDTTFSGDGKQTTDFGGGGGFASGAVAVQPDGKIVAAGGSAVNDEDFALARYTTGGVLDIGFDGDGLVTTDFPLS